MIPILYDKTEKEFRTLGIGPLSDAISCKVTEERNGTYELRMSYPITGVHYADITNEAIIFAIPADGKGAQPFRIYKISRPINGKISVYAEHLSYQLSHIVVMPFAAHGAWNTLSGLIDNSIGDQPFSVWTDIANGTTEYNQTVPASFRSRLGGVSGSVLDCFGGEYEFDQWNVKLHAHRGTDRGVSIEYGKNLLSVTQEENIANVVTGIVPMWKSNDGETVVTLPEVLIESEYADRYTFKRNIVYDFSSDFQAQPTEEELREKAESYVSSNLIGVPEVSIDVDFVALSDTEEYKDLEKERINLCDIVTVRFAELGIDTTAKVVKTVYDVLGERYTKVSIGSVKASIVDTVNSIQQTQKEDSDKFKSFVTSTLAKQKEIMTGGLGGHVVVNYVNGYPSEIVIGDTDNIKTMKHCIVINKNGIGFSDGYNADVSSAWTIDGTFSADYILTGTLNATLLRAGIIKSAKNDGNYWDLDTGEFAITGYVTDQELSDGLSSANTTAKGYADGALSNANTYTDQQAQGAFDTAKNYADGKASALNNSLTQTEIFNRLTNNGQTQGIYLQNGKIYLNAEYIQSGTIKGITIEGATITGGEINTPKQIQFINDGNVSKIFASKAIINGGPEEPALLLYSSNFNFLGTSDDPLNSFSVSSKYFSLMMVETGVYLTHNKDRIARSNISLTDTYAYLLSEGNGIYAYANGKVEITSNGAMHINSKSDIYENAKDSSGNVKSRLLLYSNGSAYLDSIGNNIYIRSRTSENDANKAFLDLLSNGQVWLCGESQSAIKAKGNSYVESVGNNVYVRSRNSDDTSTNAQLVLQNDGKAFLIGNGNGNTFINGYPAVRINGTYHDIFFQWNGASLIATVDVTQVWSTSDRRLKDQIDDISDDYIDAIGSAEIKQFIFTDEIYDKSIKHFGVIAQDVREALEAKGINPEEIAVNNHFDRDGEEYYGIDKDEFFMARIAYDEKIIKELKNEISDLREQIKQIKELLK